MRWLYIVIFAFILFIMKNSLFHNMHWHGTLPDIALLLLVAVCVSGYKTQGVSAGLLIGLVFDVMTGRWFGYNILSLTLTGYLLIQLNKQVYLHRPAAVVGSVVGGSLLRSMMHMLFVFLGSMPFPLYSLLRYEAFTIFYTVFLALIALAVGQILHMAWRSLELSH